jgi:hypothetical protein
MLSLPAYLQKQALQWAIEHENPKLPTKEEDKPVQFWQYRKTGAKVRAVPESYGLLIHRPAGLLLQWCAFVMIGSSRSATHVAL